jgi:hypothetical protein
MPGTDAEKAAKAKSGLEFCPCRCHFTSAAGALLLSLCQKIAVID